MSLEANKTIVRRAYEELLHNGNFENLEEIVHERYVDHTQPPGWPTDREGLRRQVSYFRSAFPDIHVVLEDMIAEGDLVAHRQTMRGTHRGEFFGIAPTGNRVEMTGSHFFRIADGKLIEHRANNDDLGMLRQLGAIPPESTGEDGD
jgi:predicted ester cyclase